MNDLDLSAPHPLQADESATLTSQLRSYLRLTNCSCVLQAEEDATDLLNYALDMIGDMEPIGKVLEELAFMEMEICDDEVLDNLRTCLADFLVGMINEAEGGKQKKYWRRDGQEKEEEEGDPASYEEQLLRGENHVSVDLSAKTAADKNRNEMEMLFGGGGGRVKSLKNIRTSMYNERGELIKQPRGSSQDDEDDEDGLLEQGMTIDQMRREELMAVMNDRSLTKTEKSKKMDEVRAKYGIVEMKQSARRATKTAQKDNSHMSSTGADHHHHPLQRRRSNASDISDNDDVTSSPKPSIGGVDLSAKAAAAKHAKEMESLFGGKNNRGSLKLKDRMSMYNDKGEIIKNKIQDTGEDSHLVVKEKTQDELRREELMVVMRDRTLNKEAKAERMEEIRQKYNTIVEASSTTKAPENTNTTSICNGYQRRLSISSLVSTNSHTSENNEMQPPPPGGVDLSAKAAAEKNAREMASIFGNSGEGKTKMSSNRDSYKRQLEIDSKRRDGEEHVSFSKPQDRSNGNGKKQPPSLDQQRRAELQAIMKDSSLKKDERRGKMEEVKARYKAMAQGQEHPRVQNSSGASIRDRDSMTSSQSSSSSSSHPYPVADHDEGDISSSGRATKPANHCSIDLSAKSYVERSKNEIESINVKSLSERKSMYSNNSTIVAGQQQQQQNTTMAKRTERLYAKHRGKTAVAVDPTSFAVAENGLYGVHRSKKKSTSHEYAGRF